MSDSSPVRKNKRRKNIVERCPFPRKLKTVILDHFGPEMNIPTIAESARLTRRGVATVHNMFQASRCLFVIEVSEHFPWSLDLYQVKKGGKREKD